jgi:lipoprotein-releasing system ATP-binding protein
VAILQLKNIKKNFLQGEENFDILSDVNLTLKESEIVALVGPSGSGKTTLLQICGLLDKPSSGTLILDGHDCSNLSDIESTNHRRNSLGFIYQFHHLLPEFTALENIIIPQMINNVTKSEAKEKAAAILDNLGLGHRLNSIPSELSGGEQQRVAIARALINNPKLILADEPTGNLDPHNSEKVFQILLNEVRSKKVSAIIVTHNLEIAKKTDRILTIRDGQVENYK